MSSVPPQLWLTLCVFFWSGNAVVGKAASEHMPAFSLSFWRWVVALAFILPFGYPRIVRQWSFYRSNWRFLFFIAFLSVALYNTFQYWALNWTSAINVGIISASLPIMILLMSTVIGHEKPNRYQYTGSIVATAGVLYVISRSDLQVLLNLSVNFGDGLILLAVIGWAVYSILLKRVPPDIEQVGLLTALIVLGILGIVPFYAWDLVQGKTFEVNAITLSFILYVSLFPSLLAYVFWNHAVSVGGANLAGIFVNLLPVFVTLLAIVFLGEHLAVFHVLGIGLIFLGIYVATGVAHRHAFRNQ